MRLPHSNNFWTQETQCGINCCFEPVPWMDRHWLDCGAGVRGRSKPASRGRIKTSQFEGIIIGWGAHENETLTGESTQIERVPIDLNAAPGGLVQPGRCA